MLTQVLCKSPPLFFCCVDNHLLVQDLYSMSPEGFFFFFLQKSFIFYEQFSLQCEGLNEGFYEVFDRFLLLCSCFVFFFFFFPLSLKTWLY